MTFISLEYSNPVCLVCENDGEGVHYGVQTCRACAMFYSRSQIQATEFQCKRHRKFCDLRVAEHRLMCKYCRLKKCEEVGMRDELKKIPPKTNNEFAIYLKNDTVRSRERVVYSIWHPVTQKPVRWVDIGPIIRRSREILEEFHPPTTSQFQSLNSLQKMTFSLEKLRSGQSFSPKFKSYMIFDDYFSHWEEMMTRAATWLMHSEQFRSLPIHERLSFFKIVWAVWRRFERNSMSAIVFGQKCLDEKLLLISDDMAMRQPDFEVDITEISGAGMNAYRSRIRKQVIQYFDAVARPCLEWNFTEMELNFALSQIIWMYASRKLLGQTLTAAESFLSEISENLHEYYKNERKIRNYASRLAVLMEMVNNVLKIQSEHEKTMEMAFLFDMFSIVISEPAFFSV